jgi:pimeloyl-ACP methyl ester carboxylesterase
MERNSMEMPGKNFTEGFVDADGFHIRYMQAGAGPALVFLPGSAGLELSFAMDSLAKNFRVIAFEPPGWGTSPDNPRTKSLRELAETMAAATAALGVQQYNLVGTSMGGTVALWTAALHPERVTSLILEGSMSFRRGHWTPIAPEQMQAMLDTIVAMPALPHKPWATGDFIREQFRRRFRVVGMVDSEFDDDLAARLRNVKIPTLVLYGANDMLVKPTVAGVYQQIIGGSEAATVADAGHDIQGEQPDVFANLVRDFVQKRATGAASRGA